MTDCEIWHGDSRDLAPTIQGPVSCVIADPPYGVNFVSRRAETPEGKRFVKAIVDDANLEQAVTLFDEVMDALLPRCAETAELYVFTRWDIVGEWITAVRRLERHGFAYKMLLVWDKGIPGMGDIDANWGCGHELILYLKRGRRDMPRRRSGIIHVDKLGSKQHIHPTEKPVALMEVLIAMSTSAGELVVDPFSGSGATAVAAQKLGRRAIGIERDEQYISASRNRLGELVLPF